MLARKTVKNQITLPKKIVERFPGATHFDIRVEGDRIVLRPVDVEQGVRVREKLERLGLDDEDVQAAVRWARRRPE